MYIKVKLLDKNAKMPIKAHDDDFCYDIYATSVEEIHPNVYKYHTGLSFEIVNDNNDDVVIHDIDLRPRSSIWKTGLVLSCSEGTVDNGYRGEVTAVFYHVVKTLEPYKVGDRIAQIKVGTTPNVRFVKVDELSEGSRGDNGYGSTGK